MKVEKMATLEEALTALFEPKGINAAIQRLLKDLESYPGMIDCQDAEDALSMIGFRAWTYMDSNLTTYVEGAGEIGFRDMVVYLDEVVIGTINIHGGVTVHQLRIPLEREADILQAIAGFYH